LDARRSDEGKRSDGDRLLVGLASTSAKMKLFQAKMNDNRPAAAIPGPASGKAMRRKVDQKSCPAML
jgi:hypothetical protein